MDLAKHPEKMQDLTPRKFEELVAALFRAKGYDVELTPADLPAVPVGRMGSHCRT
jgi:hypothetical protein